MISDYCLTPLSRVVQWGETALNRASCHGYEGIVKLLLENKADTDLTENVTTLTSVVHSPSLPYVYSHIRVLAYTTLAESGVL